MKNVLTLLLITNITIASGLEDIATDKKLNESIALSHHFKEFNENQKGISFLTVGADGACTYSSIQAAIDNFLQSPLGNIDIRIATNKTYVENIVIGNTNISLSGGYSNCSNPTGAGGGLLSNDSDLALFLDNVDIRNNTARNGAGIAIVGGDTDLMMKESLVLGNVADYG
ncbi:hypothetical protein MNBD_GAMMA01-132 [hydrothermal vent metagenome]|uniref:Uncharacterized protein n=1 Tax=hydrothermal vent metagenome TaxID=652676 RepID=A0A3B0VLE9_9ZZZZ